MSEFQPYEYALDEESLYMDLTSVEKYARVELDEKSTDLRIGIMEMMSRHGALNNGNGFAYYQFRPKAYGNLAMFEPGIDDVFFNVTTETAGEPSQIVLVTNEMLAPNEVLRKQGVITKEFVLSASNQVSLSTSSAVIDFENAATDGHEEGNGSPLIIPIDRERVTLAFATSMYGEERITDEVDGEIREVYWQRLNCPYDSLEALTFASEVGKQTSMIEPWAASWSQK